MTLRMSNRFAVGESEYSRFTMNQLVDSFLVSKLFQPNHIEMVYTHYDRLIVGGAMPTDQALELDSVEELRAVYFLQRRELGVINVGGPGRIKVDDGELTLENRDAAYIGRGTRKIEFFSQQAHKPALFYFNSAPAHQSFPNQLIRLQDAERSPAGDEKNCNERVINKLIVTSTVDTCQLQMGMTELMAGSVWNTMPAHTHARRMEAYFYFQVPEDQAICHFMGPQHETRHLWLGNHEAVVSPPWSIHSGVGTGNYSFIWGMAGENVDYEDMDTFQPNQLRRCAQ